MKAYNRMDRVNELLKRELSEQFERVVAPVIQGVFTLTGVSTSPDLRHAHVHVSFMGPESEKSRLMKLLNRERIDMQSLIARRIKLKYTPRLQFELDHTAEQADRVLSIINDLHIDDE